MLLSQINYLKKRGNLADWLYRSLSTKYRSLPNCIIAGAQKAGTSSLYHYLTQHPQVQQSFSKEIHYFSGGTIPEIDTYKKGENWYRAHFAMKRNMRKNDICVDATPMYLFNPLVPERIKNLIPDCKIIILLRDPVERAISHYFHTQRFGFESLSIKHAMESEQNRLKSALDNNDYADPAFRLFSYQSRGLYLEQIKRYQAYFPKEQLLILSTEELFNHPKLILKEVFEFLRIGSEQQISDLRSQNQGNNKLRVPNEVYTDLKQFFSKPNSQLFEHLDKQFNWQSL